MAWLSLKIKAQNVCLYLFQDGTGYVDDGREIFDDDPNEIPEKGLYNFYLQIILFNKNKFNTSII